PQMPPPAIITIPSKITTEYSSLLFANIANTPNSATAMPPTKTPTGALSLALLAGGAVCDGAGGSDGPNEEKARLGDRLTAAGGRNARIAAGVVREIFRRLAPDGLLQMPAQVGEQDLAVSVAIGGAAADPVDDDARERAHRVAARVRVALARGLQPGRGGEN